LFGLHLTGDLATAGFALRFPLVRFWQSFSRSLCDISKGRSASLAFKLVERHRHTRIAALSDTKIATSGGSFSSGLVIAWLPPEAGRFFCASTPGL
jgi:hypothetical protein